MWNRIAGRAFVAVCLTASAGSPCASAGRSAR